MSKLQVDDIVNKGDDGSVGFSRGAVVTGVATATSFSGALTGNVTGNVTGNTSGTAGGLTGTPNITVGTVTGTDATFSGNLTVQGTTTTIDTAVTDVDSLAVDGLVTVGAGLTANGHKVEEGRQDSSTGLNGLFVYDLDAGHVWRFGGATAGNYYPNFRINASSTLSSKMGVGDVTVATLIVASSSHYCLNQIQIDGSTSNVTTSWIGGSAPSAANGSGFDIYSFTIMKTAATPAYHIIANATSAA